MLSTNTVFNLGKAACTAFIPRSWLQVQPSSATGPVWPKAMTAFFLRHGGKRAGRACGSDQLRHHQRRTGGGAEIQQAAAGEITQVDHMEPLYLLRPGS